jgi:hypothetical protein
MIIGVGVVVKIVEVVIKRIIVIVFNRYLEVDLVVVFIIIK